MKSLVNKMFYNCGYILKHIQLFIVKFLLLFVYIFIIGFTKLIIGIFYPNLIKNKTLTRSYWISSRKNVNDDYLRQS